jgi:hypothetical protein
MPPADNENPNPEENASPQANAGGLDAQAEELAACEAILEQLVSEQNVWDYLDTIQHRYRVPPQHRQHFYNQFIALVAVRPSAEQDALITAGQAVFRYRVDTARKDVAALRQTQGTAIKIVPTLIADDFIAEIIHVPGDQASVKYMKYNEGDNTTEIVDRITIGTVTYMPPQTRLVDTGTLLLPTGIEEYGDGTTEALLHELQTLVGEYLYIDQEQFRDICGYYVLLSWLFDRFDVVPYIRFIGAPGSGKTRALQVLGALSYRPVFAGGATTASPIFRIIERFHGTLTLDEADFNERSDLWSEIVKVLNVGYQRGGNVLRAERKTANDQYDAEAYDCYAPKILATRRRFPDDALESRCLSYTTQPGGDVPLEIPLSLGAEWRESARLMRNKLLLWRFRTFRNATLDPRERFKGLDARLNQILQPLLAIAGTGPVRQRILLHAYQHQVRLKEDRRESFDGRVVAHVLAAWKNRTGEDSFLMKSVNERVKSECEEMGVRYNPAAIGKSIRDTFKLATEHRGGMVWIKMTNDDAQRLARRYGINPDPAVASRVQVKRTPVMAAPLATSNGVQRTPVS